MPGMSGYTKLFSTILASTIWRESHQTRIVWITMLAMADRDGVVEASIPGLADMARVTVKECEEALVSLMSPDPYSRTKDHDGRRVAEVDGGWAILNHGKYRAKMNADERREYLRLKQQEARDKRQQTSTNVNMRQQPSTSINVGQQESTQSTHAEAEAEASTPPISPDGGRGFQKPPPVLTETQRRLCAIYRRRESTGWSDKEIRALKRRGDIPEEEIKLIEDYYGANLDPKHDYRRRDLLTLLNNWPGEVDRARNFKPQPSHNLF